MSLVRKKDRTGLISECCFWANYRGNYWQVFLWKNVDSFRKNTKELTPGCYAAHIPLPTLMDPESGELLPNKKMGEVHFIKDGWNLEAVAHELCHAFIHRLRCLCPSYKAIIQQDEIEKEESCCYEFGRWVSEIYAWLWSLNPPKYTGERSTK